MAKRPVNGEVLPTGILHNPILLACLGIVMCAVWGIGQAVRINRAARRGDWADYHSQILLTVIISTLIVVMVLACFLFVRYMFGPAAALRRRLRGLFPLALVTSIRDTWPLADSDGPLAEIPHGKYRFTLGLTATADDVRLWSGIFTPRCGLVIPWSTVSAVRVVDDPEGIARYIEFEVPGSPHRWRFGVVSDKTVDREPVRDERLREIASSLDALRKSSIDH